MTRRSIAFAFALLSLAAGPVAAHDTVGGTPDVTITVGNALSDRDVHVAAGAIVRFDNTDDRRHRFRSRAGDGFDTGNIEHGAFAQVRLTSPGTYTYIDERDDGATQYHGRIVVGAAATENASAPSDGATVTIGDRVFQPSTTRITVGGSVTFRNEDSDEHTATGDDIDSGTLSPGASYRQTFDQPGTYDFLCIFHPEMQGSIEVVGAVEATPAPPATPATPATPAPTSTAPPDDAAIAIEIADLAFDPPTLDVPAGTTVRWTNTGAAPHTVTAQDDSFDSGTLESGAAFEQTFVAPGTFTYVCQIHPEMQGTIEVTGTAAATAPTASDDAEGASVDLGSLGGIALAVTMISIASALFARSLRGTVRP